MLRFCTIITLLKSVAAGEFSYVRLAYRLRVKKIDLETEHIDKLNLSIETSYWYSNSGNLDLVKILRRLNITASDSILDFGSGKGGALLIFSLFPFSKISGVEISERLIEIAKTNFEKLGIADIRTFHADASGFDELDSYNHFYLFNPFPPNTMDGVLKNIVHSVNSNPRKIRIVYKLPTCHDLITANGFKKIKEFKTSGHPVSVYENRLLPSTLS